MEKKLDVKNLKISFRTINGKVQAVRDVSFSLEEGETLAIVGESGSGKSVTSRAILGILADNAIIENGEIIYDGKDLLKMSEEDFHSIRGDKIAMIFQDPMSSLNPIMKTGKQLTEAMILKNKASRRNSKKQFNETLKLLGDWMIKSSENASKENVTSYHEKINKFVDFEKQHLVLQQAYNNAYANADNCIDEIDNLLFEIEKKVVKDIKRELLEIVKLAKGTINRFVVRENYTNLENLVEKLSLFANVLKKSKDYSVLPVVLNELKTILQTALALDKPNLFTLGYYTRFINSQIPEMPVKEMNVYTKKDMDEGFMLAFIADAEKAIGASHKASMDNEQLATDILTRNLAVFDADILNKSMVSASYKEMVAAVNASIDRLSIHKDNLAYTFYSSIKSAIEYYFTSYNRNIKEQKRIDKQTAKYDRLVARNKKPDWKIVPADIRDLDLAKGVIKQIISNLIDNFNRTIQSANDFNVSTASVEIIDFLKEKASAIVYRVTNNMAKNKAIKLLEEVGITEPRIRYNQYPFEFSGGMRQRIVIAIALAANPDILICDEPTTALDVTIQAQILELINNLKQERQLTVIFITHDLGVVANMADKIAVMYAGKIVEYGTSYDIFYRPTHPYTWALLSSMPDLDTNEKLEAIPGTPPNMIYPPVGDAFAPRNRYAMQIDFEQQPPMFKIADSHYAATWLLHPNAPKVDPPKTITDRIKRMQQKNDGGNE